LLGPTLNGLGNRMSREEIYESIMNPSAIIKPSMEGTKITLKDGKVLLGRIVNANEQQFDLMLIGNKVFQVKRTEIATIETQKKSLMYEGLIKNLSKADRESLLDYLQSLK
jgi:putative heme-binding domain-containing protein